MSRLDALDRPRGRTGLRALARLWPFMRPYRARLLLAIGALLVAAAAGLAMPIGVRLVIDQGFSADNTAAIDRHFLLLFAIAVVLALFSALRFYLVAWLGERVVADVRDAVYAHVLRLGPAFFEVTRSGEVQSRLTTDTTLVQSIAGVNLSITLRSVVTLLGALVMLTLTSAKLTGIILLVIPLVLVPVLVFGRRVRRLSRETQDRVASASGMAGETIGAIEAVQAFALEAHQARRFHDAVERAFEAAQHRIRLRSLLTVLAITILFGAVVFVLWLGAQAVIEGQMSAGELGQFLLFAIFVAASAASLSEMWSEVQRAGGAVERIVELLDAPLEISAPVTARRLPEPARGELAFSQVNFAYPTRNESSALSDFTLAIEPGETVALVGPSGAGKTTVFTLALRFRDPNSGLITLDGVPLRDADPQAIRERIGIVPQDTVVFADSVLENIRLGRPSANDEEVTEAARAAGVDAFVADMPQGYETFIGERGTRLSGGQRQRIAIARAMLKDAPIMLLDEATSSLDAHSERLVQQALETLMADRTTVVIAHRLATVLRADRIVVMDAGRIVAIGRHEALCRDNELYAHLAALQFDAS
ncbi:MAG: ATP-binding cassette subfamily B protein [Gammaproteobacteria bacterium]